MDIQFLPRYGMIRGLYNGMFSPDSAFISINDRVWEQEEMRGILSEHTHGNFIILGFRDTVKVTDGSLTNIDAKKLRSFIQNNSDVDGFVVHCEMGISRSAAVAKYINEYYSLNNPILNTYHSHNPFVYAQLSKIT